MKAKHKKISSKRHGAVVLLFPFRRRFEVRLVIIEV